MSTAQILLLGAIAGLTIFLGLPLARMRNVTPGTKAFLGATAREVIRGAYKLTDRLPEGVVEHGRENRDESADDGRHGHLVREVIGIKGDVEAAVVYGCGRPGPIRR